MTRTCPKCHYVRRPGDTAPDYECPSCGIVYAKFVPRPDPPPRPVPPPEPPPEPPPSPHPYYLDSEPPSPSGLMACDDCGGKISKRAVTCPHCGAPMGVPGVTLGEVAVIDVKMRFGSMVTLMVQFAFALIPAALIVAVLWYLFLQLLAYSRI